MSTGTQEDDLHVDGEGLEQQGSKGGQRGSKRSASEPSTISTACMYCRRSKMKCIRESEEEICKRCKAAGIECETRARQSGRRPKNAPRLVQPAYSPVKVRRTSTSSPGASGAGGGEDTGSTEEHESHQLPAAELELAGFGSLGDQTMALEPLASTSRLFTGDLSFLRNPFALAPVSASAMLDAAAQFGSMPSPPAPGGAVEQQLLPSLGSAAASQGYGQPEAESAARVPEPSHQASTSSDKGKAQSSQNFTSTPLELLADIGAVDRRGSHSTFLTHLGQGDNDQVDHRRYFGGSVSPSPFIGGNHPDWDPIALSLLTLSEAQALFDIFVRDLLPYSNTLDGRTSSLRSVRLSSSALITAILSVAAKFVAGHEATAVRLERHYQRILTKVLVSAETNLAFVQSITVVCPWMNPGQHVSLDPTTTYLAIANQAMAKLRKPSAGQQSGTTNRSFDGHEARSYERTFLTLWVYDHGLALVSGRPSSFTLPPNELVASVEAWAQDPLSTPADFTLAAIVVLRRDLLNTIAQVTNHGLPSDVSEATSRKKAKATPGVIKAITEEFLANWRAEWQAKAPESQAYLSVIGHHTELSLYMAALHDHVGRPTEVAMLQQCLYAGLQTCRAFIAGRGSLKCCVNNALFLIAYAAAFSLKLLLHWKEPGLPIENSINRVLTETADFLEDIGSSPPHRQGRSRLYGARLKSRITEHMATRAPSRNPTPPGSPAAYALDLPLTDEVGPDLVHMSEESLNELLLAATDGSWVPLNNTYDSSLFIDPSEFFGGGGDTFTWPPTSFMSTGEGMDLFG